MKKIVIVILFFVALTSSVQAQRLLPKQKGFFISAGMPLGNNTGLDKEHFTLSLGMTYTTKNANYWIFGVNYIRKDYTYRTTRVPMENVLAECGYMLNIFSDGGKNCLLNTGIGGVAGYEIINKSKELLYDGATLLDKDNAVYGVSGQISLDVFLTDKLIVFTKAKTVLLWGTDLGQFRPQIDLGLRVSF